MSEARPDPEQIVATRRNLESVVRASHPYPAGRFAGTGIVICAGGSRMLTCAWVAVNVLRRVVGCRLPIELWHIGPRELGPTEATLFAELDVEAVDALGHLRGHPARILGAWELKAYALVHSRFERVILLDADNVAVIDPAELLEAPEFARTGAIFWPDLVRLHRDNPIWELTGVRYRSEPSWESGQACVDKSRCWRALQVALHLNMHSEIFYPHTHGDKDTFHLAWLACDMPVAMPPYPARATGTGIVQRDFAGRMAFQHRSGAKWLLRGQNPRSPDFRYERECLQFLDELRERWSGRIEPLQPASPADLADEERLASIRWFRLEPISGPDRWLELLPAGRVGVGANTGGLLRWWIRNGVVRFDGVEKMLPPLAADGTGFRSGRGDVLRPEPEAGSDALGQAVAAVVDQYAEAGTILAEDVVTTLVALSRTGDISAGIARARSRWAKRPDVLETIRLAQHRAGILEPSFHVARPTGYEPVEP